MHWIPFPQHVLTVVSVAFQALNEISEREDTAAYSEDKMREGGSLLR